MITAVLAVVIDQKAPTQAVDSIVFACRSAIPVITAVLAVVIEQKTPTKAESMGLLVLTSGVMLAVYEGSGGTSRGIMICIAGEHFTGVC